MVTNIPDFHILKKLIKYSAIFELLWEVLVNLQTHVTGHSIISESVIGPINALVIFPGASCPHAHAAWAGRIPKSWGHVCSRTAVPEFCNKECSRKPFRYKAVMRTSVWMNFTFNSIWLLAIILQHRNSLDNVSEITMDCNKQKYLETITLAVWITGLASCFVVEIYLRYFPKLLALNKNNDYCLPGDDFLNQLKSPNDSFDPVNATSEILDTGMESFQTLPFLKDLGAQFMSLFQ